MATGRLGAEPQFGLTAEERAELQRLSQAPLDRGPVEDGKRCIALMHKQISEAVKAQAELARLAEIGEAEVVAQGGEGVLRDLLAHQAEIRELAKMAYRPDYESNDPYEINFSGPMGLIRFRQKLAIEQLRRDSEANDDLSDDVVSNLLVRFERRDNLFQALSYLIRDNQRGNRSDNCLPGLKKMAAYLQRVA